MGLILIVVFPIEISFANDAIAPISVSKGKNDWEVTGAAGLTLADGNADTLAYSLQLLATRMTDVDETYLDANYFYADDSGLETANALSFSGQYNRFLAGNFYYGFNGALLSDQVAELDYRIDANTLFGYYLWKNDRSFLALEAGPGYTWEDQGGNTDSYANLRFAERFEYRFSNRSKFWQSIMFTPQVDDFDNQLIIADAGIDTLITNRWSLRTFIRHRVDNTPAAGLEKGDTSLLVGLAYSLSGFPEPAPEGRRTLKADRAPSPIAAMGWSSSAAIGYSLASGNADSNTTTAMYDSAYRSASHEFFVNAAANYSQNAGATSIDNMRANVQYNHLLGTRYFAGVGTGYQRDDMADLAYRFTPVAVGGVYLVKNDEITLSLEAGPGYTFEEVGGITDDFLSIQGAQRFAYALSPRCTFNQNLIYNSEASDTDNFVMTASSFLDTDITNNLTLRIAASFLYDNVPALNRERHDTTLTAGFAIKF